MITSVSAAGEQFLASMNDLQARVDQAQAEVSTGLKVNKASDAPLEVGDIFQQRADLAHMNQIEQNLNLVKAQVDSADSSVQSAVQLIENAISLGTQGASTIATPEARAALATQVQSLLGQLVSVANTQVNGVYIFSGDLSGSPSYQLDSSSPTGVDRLIKTQVTQQIEDPSGVTFQVAMTAQDLFDKRTATDGIAPENAFAALHNLQVALQSGDAAGINNAIASLQSAGGYLNEQLGFYGSVQNRITSSVDLAKKFEVQSQTQLSNLQDADVPTAAIELTQATSGLDAAMAAQAKRPTTSLFDYLR